jgi:hypothetical protein
VFRVSYTPVFEEFAMEKFVIFMLIAGFAIGQLVRKHPQASGMVAKGIFRSFFR